MRWCLRGGLRDRLEQPSSSGLALGSRIVAGLFLVCLACGPRLASAEVLVVLGDSLSAGYGIDVDAGWVSLLKQRLHASGASIQVVNASISGDTTAGGLARIDSTLADHQPAVVVVELGGNDGLRGLSLTTTEANLNAIVERSRHANATVLLLGVRLPPNYGPAYIERFAAMFAAVADRYGLRFVPRFLHGVAERPELMQSDGIHPTAEAQPKLLDNVWPELAPLLRLE